MSLTNNVNVKVAAQIGLTGAASIFFLKPAGQELDTLSTRIAALTASLEGSAVSLLAATKNLPKGIAVGVSFVRATSAIKRLTAPIPSAEASAILNSFRAVQTRTLAFVTLFKNRSSSYEGFAPGVSQYGLSTLQGLFNSLSNALAAADPSSIPTGLVQELQSSITTATALQASADSEGS